MNSASLPALQLMTSQALSFKVSGSEHSPSVLSKVGTGRALSRAKTHCGLPPTLHASSDRTQNKCLPSISSIGAEANEGRTVCQRLPWGIGKMADAKRERHKVHSTAATTIDCHPSAAVGMPLASSHPHPCLTDLYDPTKCLIPSKHSRIGSRYELMAEQA